MQRRPSRIRLLLGLLCLAPLGRALPVLAETPPPRTFDSVSQGVVADIGLGTSVVGDSILGEVGGKSAGIRTVGDGRWLLQWDALLAARGGVLANAHPYLALLGAHAGGYAELGDRFLPANEWSPYVGVRAAADLKILVPPGDSLATLKTLNDMDGVGGLSINGAPRVALGTSYLSGARSLLLDVFVQEGLRAPAVYTPGAAFTELGIDARFDIERSLFVDVEAIWGRSITQTNVALSTTDQTTHEEVSASFRKIFANGMWLGAALDLAQETDHVVYAGAGNAYDTANAPTFAFTVLYGFPLGRQE